MVYEEANDMKFTFTFEDETETDMTIGVEGGTLTLERQETDLLASFFETMLTRRICPDGRWSGIKIRKVF